MRIARIVSLVAALLLTTRLPAPGMANTASITTAPDSRRLTCRPTRVSSVTLMLRRPCFHRISIGPRRGRT